MPQALAPEEASMSSMGPAQPSSMLDPTGSPSAQTIPRHISLLLPAAITSSPAIVPSSSSAIILSSLPPADLLGTMASPPLSLPLVQVIGFPKVQQTPAIIPSSPLPADPVSTMASLPSSLPLVQVIGFLKVQWMLATPLNSQDTVATHETLLRQASWPPAPPAPLAASWSAPPPALSAVPLPSAPVTAPPVTQDPSVLGLRLHTTQSLTEVKENGDKMQ